MLISINSFKRRYIEKINNIINSMKEPVQIKGFNNCIKLIETECKGRKIELVKCLSKFINILLWYSLVKMDLLDKRRNRICGKFIW